jgi:hypothetical protein
VQPRRVSTICSVKEGVFATLERRSEQAFFDVITSSPEIEDDNSIFEFIDELRRAHQKHEKALCSPALKSAFRGSLRLGADLE